MAHEPKANPSLAGAEDPTGKMPPRANRDAPIMTVDLVDAGLDAFSLGQRLPSPFEIEALRQPFQQVEQTLSLRKDESCDGRRGDR